METWLGSSADEVLKVLTKQGIIRVVEFIHRPVLNEGARYGPS